jgi:glucose/mannose transport system permease protein
MSVDKRGGRNPHHFRGPPRARWTRNISAKIAAIPDDPDGAGGLPRRHDLDRRLFLHQFEAVAAHALGRLRPVRKAVVDSRWLVSIENLLFYGVMSLIFTIVMGFILAVLMDQKIRLRTRSARSCCIPSPCPSS